MPQTTSASVPALSGVSSYDISVDGTALDNSLQVISISISKELNKISVAKMIIRDGNAAEKDFEISNGNLFIPGKKILIKIGTDGKNVQAFKGIIIKHAIKIKENGSSELHIE